MPITSLKKSISDLSAILQGQRGEGNYFGFLGAMKGHGGSAKGAYQDGGYGRSSGDTTEAVAEVSQAGPRPPLPNL